MIEPGFFIGLQQRDQNRLRRYMEYWRAYHGVQDPALVNADDPINSWNFIRRIVDVGVYFLVGAGFSNKVPKPLIPITLPYLEEVWKQNDRQGFAYNVALTASVTGDWFTLVAHQEPTEMEKRIRPFSKGRVRFKRYGSEQCFPVYDALDMDKMVSARIETYYSDNGTGNTPGTIAMQRHTMTITDDVIMTQVHDGVPKYSRNILGEIPLVHCKNLPLPGDYFGLSDIQDLLGPVKDLNEKTTDISNAINYNGTPTLALFGAKAKELPKGNQTFWSGLPADAKIQVIRMGLEDIGAATKYVEMVTKVIHEVSSVPEAALGGSMAISNTSGVALNLVFQPLIQKMTVKRAFAEPAFERLNYFALRIGAIVGLIDLPFDLCHCGGRVVEVETGETAEVWDPNLETFVTTPERKKKCYQIDPQTLKFMRTKDVAVKVLMNYGVGSRVTELPFEDIKSKAASARKSFWSVSMAESAEEGVSLPNVPLDEFPREPEAVTVITQYVSPTTGEVVKERRSLEVLIPTECIAPQYVNPYETDVDFNDVLPKDDTLKSEFLSLAQQNSWVDAEFCQNQFPQIAAAKHEINKRISRQKTAEESAQKEAEEKAMHQQLAAKDQSESSVAGKNKKAENGSTQ